LATLYHVDVPFFEEPLLEVRQEPAGPVELKVDFGHQHAVHVAGPEACVQRDEPRAETARGQEAAARAAY